MKGKPIWRLRVKKSLNSSPEQSETDKMAELFPNFKISSNISDVTTPYIFFIKDVFDFQPEEANFHRMIFQAEEQRLVENEKELLRKIFFNIQRKYFLNFKVPILLLVLGLTKMVIGIKVVFN